MRDDDPRAGDSEVVFDIAIDQSLAVLRRIVARVEKSVDSAGTMAQRAIGVDVGTHAVVERCGSIGHSHHFAITSDRGFLNHRIEQADVIEGAQLIVQAARAGIGKVSVELPRLDTQHAARNGSMACDTFLAAGIMPDLRARRSRSGGNSLSLIQTVCRYQIGIGIIRAPFVGHAVYIAVRAAETKKRVSSRFVNTLG